MAELRRLLMAAERLKGAGDAVPLTTEERHYLRRVLRLRPGDDLAVVDGLGHLWTAQLVDGEHLSLHQPLDHPHETTNPPTPRLGLAVVGVRRGMDEVMRMACELGIDSIQPLTSQWRTPQAEDRPDRWQTILNEAVEQCERLWRPELRPTLAAEAWWPMPGDGALKALATTRQESLIDVDAWLAEQGCPQPGAVASEVWIAIGPEAGWTSTEQNDAVRNGWIPVQMGSTILRTSTAAVSAATLLSQWRFRRSREALIKTSVTP